MPIITDDFARANQKPIAPPWTNLLGVFAPYNSLNLFNNGFAPAGPDQTTGVGLSARFGDGIYSPTQSAQSTIKSIAGPLATMNITAAAFSAGSSVYTYSGLSGKSIFVDMDIVVAGMQNAGNNGDFIVTAKTGGPSSGTFTVSNASGVNESGSTGTGTASSDSLCGVAIRVTPDGQGYYLAIGTNSGEIGGAQDSRVYTIEVWAVSLNNGTYSNNFVGIVNPIPTVVPDSPGDIYKLTANGSTFQLLKNNVPVILSVSGQGSGLTSFTDVYGQHGGYPGISGQSLSSDPAMPGNDGTVWTDWIGSDSNPTVVSGWKGMAADWFSGTGSFLPTVQWSAAPGFGAIVPPPTAAYMVGDGTCYNGSGLYTGRSWANDQASSISLAAVTGGVTSVYALVRSDSTGASTYYGQAAFGTGSFGAGNVIGCGKIVSGSVFPLTSYTVGASSVPATLSQTDIIRLEAKGTTISVYHNGVLVIQGTDASLSSGTPGFQATSTAYLGYWQGDEFVTSTVTATAGTPQTANVNSAFSTNLQATVLDNNSNPIDGASVVFTAPGSGASGTFIGGLTVVTVSTDTNGNAVAPTFTANSTDGAYTVVASVTGIASPANFSLTNTGVSSMAYSVPDCRNYATFPNASRDVNGTLTYDVQTSSNSDIPPTDSRTAGAPVACGTYPQNSRTPGIFGPGEN